ncbi:MAG: UPF0182 family protein [Dehalococcoidia bacterium]
MPLRIWRRAAQGGEEEKQGRPPPPFGVPPSEEGRSGNLGPPPPVFREGSEGGGEGQPPPPPYEVARQEGRGERRWWPRLLALLVGLLVLFILANIGVGLYVDRLWFDEVGYRGVFNTRIGTQVWLFFAGFGIAFVFLLGNMAFAWRTPVEASAEPASPFPELSLPAVRRVAAIGGVVIALFLGIIFGAIASGQWDQILQLIHAEPFGLEDAQFNRDVGFFVFKLEPLQFIKGWSIGVALLGVIASVGVYGLRYLFYGGNAQATRQIRLHLAFLLAVVIGLFVWGYWLARFELAVSENGTVFGATFTDVNARSAALVVMMAVGAAAAVAVLSWPFHRRLLAPAGGMTLLAVTSVGGLLIYPALVQRFTVEPNELRREREFIGRNIEATRVAIGLDQIEEREFSAEEELSAAEAEANPEALRNIRLWDHRPLNDTLNTIQTIRPLYIFPDVDVDRYRIEGEIRQVFLSARELTHNNLQGDQANWVNRRLQFTHGFGVTVNPVDGVTAAGGPTFIVSDIPPVVASAAQGEDSAPGLRRLSGEDGQPRIYFGEVTDAYVIVNSEEEEFDFPLSGGGVADAAGGSPASQARNRYEGSGGIGLGGFFKRLALAWEFTDTNILISGSIDSESRILFRRNIQERVRELAPFLTLDADPYIVIGEDGGLYWIQDAYTTTDRFPYAQPHASGINYIRNSVKAVIDAFNGSVDLYIVDDVLDEVPRDPIIRVWEKIFPELFKPSSEFPADLRAHWRYPQDLFQIQSDQYLTYHIRSATTLFNREDIWAIPQEVLREQNQVPVEPYYVTLRLPTGAAAEFMLILPFTPRNRQNAIAWMAGRSDGENYGRLFAFRFPPGKNVAGPAQVEARIDNDVSISRQFTLLGQEGSELIRGNLLFIPVADSFLYVEPIFLQAESSRFPQLKGVIVVNGDRVALEETLAEASSVALGLSSATGLSFAGAVLPEESPTQTPPPATTTTPEPAGAEDEAGAEEEPRARPPPEGEGEATIESLIREAQAAFEESQRRLAAADFAGYGEQLDLLRRALDRLEAAIEAASP